MVIAKKQTDNGQKRCSSIFQHFQSLSDKLGKYTALIYPGVRWIHRSGKGMEQFGLDQINDPHLSKLHFYPHSTDIFDSVDIVDGLSIVFKDMSKTSKSFTYLYTKGGQTHEVLVNSPGKELMPLNPLDCQIVCILRRIVSERFVFLDESILSRRLFSIESDFVENNPSLVREYEDGGAVSDGEIKLFTNDRKGTRGRARWYTASSDVITSGKEYLNRWKVVVSSANAGGQKRSNQIAIMDNQTAFGRSRVALKTFATEREAQNFYTYCKSELIRFAFLLTNESLTSLAKLVPDIGNYSDDNGIIDFGQDVSTQLYELFQIKDQELKEHIRSVLASKRE